MAHLPLFHFLFLFRLACIVDCCVLLLLYLRVLQNVVSTLRSSVVRSDPGRAIDSIQLSDAGGTIAREDGVSETSVSA